MRVNARRVLLAGAIVAAATVGIAPPVAAAPSPGAQVGGLVRTIVIAGRFGVPDDAAMIAVNVTAVAPAAAGYITVYPCGAARPKTSNVNYFADQVVPNLVLSRIGTGGAVCVYTAADTDVLVDLVGYVPAGSALVPLATPVRRLDTRDAGGPPTPVPAGRVTELTITGRDGIPTDANVVMFNATAIAGTSPGFLTAYPCGTRPTTSSINYLPGQIVPNLVTSRISAAGSICIYNRSTADFIIDLAAYATDGISTLPTPKRLIDTRKGGGDVLPARNVLTLDVTARADVPDDATAAIYNLTSVGATAPGYATSYPCNVTRPTVSNLNFAPGGVSANGAITKLSPTGELCIFTLAPTHILVDLIGYTTDTTHYAPLTPKRIQDTRNGWQPRCNLLIIPEYPYDLDRSVYTVLDTTTGARTRVRATFDLYHNQDGAKAPYLTRDCSTLLTFDPVDPTRLLSMPVLGGPRTTAVVANSSGKLSELPDGTLVGIIGGRVTNVLTGEILWPELAGYDTNYSELSADGTIAMVTDFSPSGFGRNVQVWNIVTNRRLSSFTVPEGTSRMHLSGDGQYIVFDVLRFLGVVGGLSQSEGHATLTTITGRVVHDIVATGATYTEFVSGASMVTYAHEDDGSGVLYRWDVDGRLTPILSADRVLTSDPIERQTQAGLITGA